MKMAMLTVEYRANGFPNETLVEAVTSDKFFIILPPSPRDSSAGDPDATSDLYKLLRNRVEALDSLGDRVLNQSKDVCTVVTVLEKKISTKLHKNTKYQ